MNRSCLHGAAALVCLLPLDSFAASILYGGIGRGSVSNAGGLITIDQVTGAGSLVGVPGGVPGLTGLAYDPGLTLFGTTIDRPVFGSPDPPASQLVRLDPATGNLIGSPLDITGSDGSALVMNDLALQPGSGLLYGNSISVPDDSFDLYTIDPTSGVATLVGPSGVLNATIAFAPDGTLYSTSAIFDQNGLFVSGNLLTLDPATGAVLTTSAPFTQEHIGGLAVRHDGVIFGSGGVLGDIYTLSPGGEQTFVGFTGALVGAPGDIAFAPIPEPAPLWLIGAGLIAIGLRGFRH